MKRLIILFVMLCGPLMLTWANKGCDQRLTPEEFRARQQAFLTEKAQLSPEEAEKFFPLYFELQDSKKKLSDKIWKLYRSAKEENTTEKQYEKLLEEVYDLRLQSERLEHSYFEKFKKVIPCKKIYQVQHAELKFHRTLLKGMKPQPNTNNKKLHKAAAKP